MEDRGPNNNLLHIPVPAYTDMRQYKPIFESQALPFLKEHNPDLVIVCAGYDTLADDELAQVRLSLLSCISIHHSDRILIVRDCIFVFCDLSCCSCTWDHTTILNSRGC